MCVFLFACLVVFFLVLFFSSFVIIDSMLSSQTTFLLLFSSSVITLSIIQSYVFSRTVPVLTTPLCSCPVLFFLLPRAQAKYLFFTSLSSVPFYSLCLYIFIPHSFRAGFPGFCTSFSFPLALQTELYHQVSSSCCGFFFFVCLFFLPSFYFSSHQSLVSLHAYSSTLPLHLFHLCFLLDNMEQIRTLFM